VLPSPSGSSDGVFGAGMPRSVKLLGTIVGSTTILTGLLFYFGWSQAYYFYDYLGVESSVLHLTTQDYVQNSVDGLFVPLLVIALLMLGAVWIIWSALQSPRVAGSPHLGRYAAVAAGLGALLVLNGFSRIYVATPFNSSLGLAPISLGLGVALFFFAVRLRRRGRPTAPPEWVSAGEWIAVILVLCLALFWIANDYSADVGRSRARQFVSELRSLPDTQLFSKDSLSLGGPGITMQRCSDPEAAYRYRYDGLKLVLQSGGRYLLVPAQWSRAEGVAILLPESANIRLQFTPASAPAPPPHQPC
jgi:hypothetical protein